MSDWCFLTYIQKSARNSAWLYEDIVALMHDLWPCHCVWVRRFLWAGCWSWRAHDGSEKSPSREGDACRWWLSGVCRDFLRELERTGDDFVTMKETAWKNIRRDKYDSSIASWRSITLHITHVASYKSFPTQTKLLVEQRYSVHSVYVKPHIYLQDEKFLSISSDHPLPPNFPFT